MKVAIFAPLLAIGTGLTGVFGAPVSGVNSDLAVRGNELAAIVTRGNDMVVERDEERKKPRPDDPYFCGQPFCLESREKRDETASIVSHDEEHRKPRPHNPYWCGAPFCARNADMTPRELNSSPIQKRAEDITKCWEAFDGQIHCEWAKHDSLVNPKEAITMCWEAPDGQIYCESAADLSRSSDSITKCWESADGQIHCQYAKRNEVLNDITKCRESPQGQIHCEWSSRDPEPVADKSEV
ncbi:MAG: hypothetical protein HETSPECPRED_006375 [Heterodermia speciosa]|uniref:C2H2-type domain-containing protein n=1 Tax=Heterodermia speciosa TaxID=116794 RepID=A0A8H3IT38_9LECA|nr:MAG: hypothetical protein HETSPECPRED_006375 [Heterodermia speciosa]